MERTSLLAPNDNGRHATNPYHAILNYALALLESQVRQEINVVGLDAACGFLHADKLHRDSLDTTSWNATERKWTIWYYRL